MKKRSTLALAISASLLVASAASARNTFHDLPITKNNDLSSPTEFRCVAGAMIANVALTGTVVKLGGK